MDGGSPFCRPWGSCGVTWHCHIVDERTLPRCCQRHGTWISCERYQWWGGPEHAHLGWSFVHVSLSVHPCVIVIVHQLLVATLPTVVWPLHLV